MYQRAPATTMLNTKCAACGRALVDAASVQAGLGPHCRKAYLYEGMTDELRKNANEVIQRCAKDNVPAEELLRAVVELSLMGCDKLSERISRRAGTIIAEFTKESLRLSVKGSPKALLRELIHVRGKRLYRAGGRTVFDLPGGFAGRALVAVRRAYGDRAVLNVQGLPEMQSRPPFMYANDTGVAEMFANHDVAFEPTPEEMDAEREQQLSMFSWDAHPRRLQDGSWGACVEVSNKRPPKDGDLVHITTRAGKKWDCYVHGAAKLNKNHYVFATRRNRKEGLK